MTVYDKAFVDGLFRASLCDILKTSKINCYVAEGVFDIHHDVDQVVEDANFFLSHKCDDRCLLIMTDGSFC